MLIRFGRWFFFFFFYPPNILFFLNFTFDFFKRNIPAPGAVSHAAVTRQIAGRQLPASRLSDFQGENGPGAGSSRAHLQQGVVGEKGAGVAVRPHAQDEQVEDGHAVTLKGLQERRRYGAARTRTGRQAELRGLCSAARGLLGGSGAGGAPQAAVRGPVPSDLFIHRELGEGRSAEDAKLGVGADAAFRGTWAGRRVGPRGTPSRSARASTGSRTRGGTNPKHQRRLGASCCRAALQRGTWQSWRTAG